MKRFGPEGASRNFGAGVKGLSIVTLGAGWSNPHRTTNDRSPIGPVIPAILRLDPRGDWRWSADPPAIARAGRRSILVSFGPNRAIREGGPEWLWGRAVDGCARCHRCALGAGPGPSCAVRRLAGARRNTFPDQRAWSAGAARRQARPATGRASVSRETEPVSRHVTNAWPENRVSGSAPRIVTAGQRREAQEWRFGLRKCPFRRDADRDERRRAESARHSGAVPSFRDGETVACERSRGEHSTVRVALRD